MTLQRFSRILLQQCVALLLVGMSCDVGWCANVDDYNVIWDTPSADAAGSMPLGNGDVALNAWVEPNGDLLFLIAKNDAWSGDTDSPDRDFKHGVYGLLKLGRIRVRMSPGLLSSSGPFRQELRLSEGAFVASAGPADKRTEIRLWVDANRNVIHIDGKSAEPGQMRVTLESWRNAPTEYLEADTILPGQKNRIVWYYKGRNRDIPDLRDRTIGAAILGDGFVGLDATTLESAAPATTHHVTIHPLTAQWPTPDQWLAKLDQQIRASSQIPDDQAFREHVAWWDQFWNRSQVFVTAGPKAREVTQGYVLQRFKNACTSRGEFPIKFNGSLFVVENPKPAIVRGSNGQSDKEMPITPDYRMWGQQYWFQNTRPMYWPMMASGDFDLMKPLFRMYGAQMKSNAAQVREFYGHDGAYFRETAPFWGGLTKITPQTPGWYTTHYYTPVLELSAMMLDYYAYTQDRAFARDTMIPMVDAGVTFFDQHFQRDSDGKLLLDPVNSLEMFWKVRNPAPDIVGLRWVLRGLLDLPHELADKAARQRWERLLGEIPPVPVGQRDGKSQLLAMEDGQAEKRCNSENPELYSIYPFRLYGLQKPDIELALNAFAARKCRRPGCWSQEAVQAALLGDAATAQNYVTVHLTRKDGRMRFPAFWNAGCDYLPDEDNGGNGLHALQTMLLQFDGQKILLAPAWPKNWDADFKLHAPMQTVVQGSIRGGKMVELKVTPAQRQQDVILMEPQ